MMKESKAVIFVEANANFDVDCGQFFDELLEGIGDGYGLDLVSSFAELAGVGSLVGVGQGQLPAQVAYVGLELVGYLQHPLGEYSRGPVGKNAVSLHLSESKSSAIDSALDRLPGVSLGETPASGVDFVKDHVFELLVVDRASKLGFFVHSSGERVHGSHTA